MLIDVAVTTVLVLVSFWVGWSVAETFWNKK
jgi:hypothetical protein